MSNNVFTNACTNPFNEGRRIMSDTSRRVSLPFAEWVTITRVVIIEHTNRRVYNKVFD